MHLLAVGARADNGCICFPESPQLNTRINQLLAALLALGRRRTKRLPPTRHAIRTRLDSEMEDA